jgi:UDP-N-acetylmuramoylalanine--D-glutamate ligase
LLRIGIVGFGVVGKSVIKFLNNDRLNKTDSLRGRLSVLSFWDKQRTLDQFLDQNDVVIVSPGIDLRPFKKYEHKFLSELDLFSFASKNKKTIAITGTLGKTTVARLVDSFLDRETSCGGNIGRAMLDLLEDVAGWLVLELSSFQLERNKNFTPDIAILTNFYPNHLDRHGTIDEYFKAKWRLFENQTENQIGFFPFSILSGPYSDLFIKRLKNYKGRSVFVCDGIPSPGELKKTRFRNIEILYVKDDSCFFEKTLLCDIKKIPRASFLQNWLFLIGVMHILGEKIDFCVTQQGVIQQDAFHRCEHFLSINGIDFYNDSKATVSQATIAAVNKILRDGRPVIVVVGGSGKGVDRSALVDFLSQKKLVKKVFCLGHEAAEFDRYERYSSLSDLVHAILQVASRGDQVLFSPSGSSFDMFKNYKERGDLFKRAVLELYGKN